MFGYVVNFDVLQMYFKKYGLFLDVYVFLLKLCLFFFCYII